MLFVCSLVLAVLIPAQRQSCDVCCILYMQVELRVVAALAREQALLDAFAAGRDVHEATARVLLDKGPGVSCRTQLVAAQPATPASEHLA